MTFFKDLKNRAAIEKLMGEGKQLQEEKDLEGAYDRYCQAADLGSADAMVRIAGLYYSEMFRPVEQSNIMELFLQGIPSFPWNTVTQKVPDYKSALEWFIMAADLGHGAAACMAGSMLCEGVGCRADRKKGLRYLEAAREAGIPEAQKALCIYGEHKKRDFTPEEYDALLQQFVNAASAGQEEAYTLYDQLKGGDDTMLSRLGYVLTVAHNSGRPGFESFQPSETESGIPLIPVCWKRRSWKTFLRVDLDSFDSDDVRIAFSSDIGAASIQGEAHRLEPAGSAVYRSPAFGWLGEEKNAMLFRINRNSVLQKDALESVAEQFLLTEEEYQPENAAFLVEYGEKEYSVEIAAITGDKAEVLLRYTIGGPDTVENYFEPELISTTDE